MSNEITFDEIKVGDRIKAREVYKNGDTFEGEFTVTNVVEYFIYTGYRVFHKIHSDRKSLTFERVQRDERVRAVGMNLYRSPLKNNEDFLDELDALIRKHTEATS